MIVSSSKYLDDVHQFIADFLVEMAVYNLFAEYLIRFLFDCCAVVERVDQEIAI